MTQGLDLSRRPIYKLYASLIVFYFSDMALYMMIIWLSYQLSKNPLLLGTTLFISTIMPLLIKRLMGRNLLALPIKQLMQLRIAIYMLIVLIAFFQNSLIALTLLALLFGVLSISILSNYESYNNQLVLSKHIDANQSARIMQTVIQIGAFFGAMIGGVLLKHLSFFISVLGIALLDVLGCILVIFSSRQWHFLQTPKDSNDAHSNSSPAVAVALPRLTLYLLCLCLGLIGMHIISFNFVTPIVFQDINHWDSQSFGLASAFAGMGAFVAVFFRQAKLWCMMMAAALIAVDAAFMMSPYRLLSFTLCFAIGFFINSIRISVREQLSLLVANPKQAQEVGQLSALVYTLAQSAYSLVLGGLLLLLSPLWAKIFLPLAAGFIFICYGSVLWHTKRLSHA